MTENVRHAFDDINYEWSYSINENQQMSIKKKLINFQKNGM